MAVSLNIDTDTNKNQVQKFILDNKVFIIQTYWNLRCGWFIGLYDEDMNPLLEGIKMMPNTDLLKRHRYLGLLSGLLICVDTAPVKSEYEEGITLDNFGEDKRWQLWYYTAQEVLDYSS